MMEEPEEPVLYEQRGNVAWLTLNRPRYSNAQNGRMLYALDAAFSRAAYDDNVRAIVLRGAGKHFSAGHDIGTPFRDADQSMPERRSLWGDHVTLPGAAKAYVREQDLYLGLCRRWRELPKPTVAAVQGACIAGGLMLAWVCDLIIASETAYFADPVLAMGIPGVEYFAHAFEMHPRVAREFLYLGDKMDASRAYQLGMVNRVVSPELLQAEVELISERLAQLPPFGVTLAKQAFNLVEDLGGRRAAMDAVFHMHHLGHAQSQLTTGSHISGMDAKTMAAKAASKESGPKA
jgi:enoyl-CoA hydratase